MYIAYRIALLLKDLLPFPVSRWIARRVADLWYIIFTERRKSVITNLSLLPNCDKKKIKTLARQVMRNFSEVVTEFLYAEKMTLEQWGELVDLESLEKLVKQIRLRPSLLITGHIGNWELAAYLLSKLGANLCVIAFENPDQRVARIFRLKRARMGLRVLSTEEAGKELRKIVKTCSVGIVADRDYSGKGIPTKLFNVTVTLPSGYATLAVSEGIPTYCGFLIKCEDGKYRLVDLEKIYDPDHPVAPANVVEMFAAKLERIIAQYRQQWYLFERMAMKKR